MRKIRWILLLLSLLLLFAAGCSGGKQAQSPGLEERPAFSVETSCGALSFPEEWKEFVSVSETAKAYGTSLSFTAENGEDVVTLFTLNIGGGEGEEVGTLRGSDGTERSVHMVIDELMLEGADEDTANRLFAMQEDVNYIIEHLG